MRRGFKNKKAIAWLVMLTFLFTCIMPSGTILASTEETSKQIVKQGATSYYLKGERKSASNNDVQISKMITATENENEFDIELKVITKENLKELTTLKKEAAVVMVVDISTSMKWDAAGNSTNNVAKQRITAAQNVASAFVNDYAESFSDKALFSLVTFNLNASAKNFSGNYWVDLANSGSLSSVQSAIAGLDNEIGTRGTNIAGGLRVAEHLLTNLPSDAPSTRYVILLTDGEPNKKVSQDNGYSVTGVDSGSAQNHATTEMNAIKALNPAPTVYSVGFGNDDKNKGFQDFLKGLATSTAHYSYATTPEELAAKFEAITESITLLANAWQVTDPMGENIQFLGFYNGDALQNSALTNNLGTYSKIVEKNGVDTIDWNLKITGAKEIAAGTYEYTLKYKVRLDTTASGFEAGKAYDTNGTTELVYVIQQENNDTFEGPYTVAFDVPQVKGYKGDVTFTKTDENGKALAGAAFTLALNANANHNHSGSYNVTATSDANGIVKFENVPSGHQYTLTETVTPDGYIPTKAQNVKVAYGELIGADGKELTAVQNVYNKTSVTVTKEWDDNNNQDGKRPQSIIVKLLADGKEVRQVTLNKDNRWEHTFDNLAKTENGKAIVYTVDEMAVDGYTAKIDGYKITNTYEVEKVNVEGQKSWNDDDDRDGIRPDSIIVNLLANGDVIDELEVTAANGWAYSFTGLDKYAAGKEIVYTVTEEAVEGYETKINGYDIVNTHTPETTEVTITKVWEDNNNQDGKRPAEITVNLLANGNVADSATVTGAGNEWTYTFTNLPKYENGAAIVYTVDEAAVTDYNKAIDGYVITNTYEPELVDIYGTKTWIDGSSVKRPAEVTVQLLANGNVVDEVVVDGERTDKVWKYEFQNLPKYENGEAIVYTVAEVPVDGYVTSIDGFNIVNTIEQKYFSISGEKFWDVPEGTDLPESITVVLTRSDNEVTTLAVTAADAWKYSFDNLKAYAPDGSMYHYTVAEEAVAGYVASYNVNSDNEANRIVNITNTLVEENTPMITIEGQKLWNAPEGVALPASVTINLLQNGEAIASTTASASDNWAYKFENYPRFNDNNERYVYTVEEVPVDGFLATVVPTANGFDITNTYYVGEAGSFSVTKVVSGGDKMVPADDIEYGFSLKVKATVAEWTALLVHQRNELQDAKTAAEETLKVAEGNLENAEANFKANAKRAATTGSAYGYEYQYLMVGDKLETTSGSAYELTGLLDSNAILTTTGSAYVMNNAKALTDSDQDILDRIVAAIKAMVNRIRNFHDDVFIGMLSEEVQSSTPSALMFQKDDVMDLMNAERDVQDAEADVDAAAKALDDFLKNEVTTSTAIKVVMTPTAGGDVIEYELDAESLEFNKEENAYVINFAMPKDAGYNVAIEAAEKGTVIEYSISEIEWETENYVTTEILINGTEKAANERYVGERTLDNTSADTYVFHNIYAENPKDVPPPPPQEEDPPYYPPYNPPYEPNIPEPPVVEVPEEPVVIEEPEVPLADNPVVEIPGEIIEEEDIPLGDAPPTGDNANAAPFMMMMAFAAAGMVIIRRRFN